MDLHDFRGRPLTPGPISCPNSTCTGCLSSGMRATCPSHLRRLNLTSPAMYDGSLQEVWPWGGTIWSYHKVWEITVGD